MKLVAGKGNEKTGACWMSALHWYTRNGKSWTDQPECVSTVIRGLCIQLNDTLPTDADRERVIGPHLFAPVGTNTGDEDEQKRYGICADRAIHVFAPFWLRKTENAELIAHAARLEAMPKIVTREDAKRCLVELDKVHNAAYAYASATAYAYASATAYASAYAYALASASTLASAYAYAYAYASATASATAYASALASAYASTYMRPDERKWFEAEVIRLILDCCEVGKKSDVCASKTREEVVEFLCAFESKKVR